MPELPEVETVRRGLQPAMEGSKIVKAEARRKDLRFPFQKDFIARLEGQTVTGLGRRAKYLMADLTSGDVLLMHLGMSGSFRVLENGANDPVTTHPANSTFRAAKTARMIMSYSTCHRALSVVFNDPRRFGYMKIIARNALEEEPLLKGLGPEPLGNEFDAAMLAGACHNKKTSLKAALLDQRVVAGLGNIYVCEALYRARLSPRRLAATLATKKAEPTDHAKRLVGSIHDVLNQAIKAGGSSISDHRQTSGELGYFQHSLPGLRPRRREMPDRRVAAASCGASSRTAARPSGARSARNDHARPRYGWRQTQAEKVLRNQAHPFFAWGCFRSFVFGILLRNQTQQRAPSSEGTRRCCWRQPDRVIR